MRVPGDGNVSKILAQSTPMSRYCPTICVLFRTRKDRLFYNSVCCQGEIPLQISTNNFAFLHANLRQQATSLQQTDIQHIAKYTKTSTQKLSNQKAKAMLLQGNTIVFTRSSLCFNVVV